MQLLFSFDRVNESRANSCFAYSRGLIRGVSIPYTYMLMTRKYLHHRMDPAEL